MIELKAYAKINLTLEVLSKRPDGYHEVASVLHAVSLADMLTFKPCATLDFRCDVSILQTPDNLVPKAARLLQEATGCTKGAAIYLTKRIPIAAGLGSGSTDAAATLVGLNRLWELNLSLDKLTSMAAKLGSDVAFFLYGGTALAKGHGEKITPIPLAPEFWLVLLKPAVKSVSGKTAKLYSQLSPSHYTSGQHTEKLVSHLNQGGTMEASFLFNVFEQVAFDFFPGLSVCRSSLLKVGAKNVHLAGSGPALFAIVADKTRGEVMLGRLKKEGIEAYLAHSVGDEKC